MIKYFSFLSDSQLVAQGLDDTSYTSTAKENFIEVLNIESLSLQSKTEMEELASSSDVLKQQQEKTILEKTEEFLAGLGFSSRLKSPNSNIDSCKMLISKKKKKKKNNKKKSVSLIFFKNYLI